MAYIDDLNKIKNYLQELTYLVNANPKILADIDLLFEKYKPYSTKYDIFINSNKIASKVIQNNPWYKFYQPYKDTYKQIHNTYISNVNFYIFPELVDYKELDPYWNSFDPNKNQLPYKTANLQDYYDEFGKDRTAAELVEPIVKLIIDIIERNEEYFSDYKSDTQKNSELITFIIASPWLQNRFPTISDISLNDIVSELLKYVVKVFDKYTISKDDIDKNKILNQYFNSIIYKNNSIDPTDSNSLNSILNSTSDFLNNIKNIGSIYYTRVKQLQYLYETSIQNINGMCYKIRKIIYDFDKNDRAMFEQSVNENIQLLNLLKQFNLYPGKFLEEQYNYSFGIYVDAMGLNAISDVIKTPVLQVGPVNTKIIHNYEYVIDKAWIDTADLLVPTAIYAVGALASIAAFPISSLLAPITSVGAAAVAANNLTPENEAQDLIKVILNGKLPPTITSIETLTDVVGADSYKQLSELPYQNNEISNKSQGVVEYNITFTQGDTENPIIPRIVELLNQNKEVIENIFEGRVTNINVETKEVVKPVKNNIIPYKNYMVDYEYVSYDSEIPGGSSETKWGLYPEVTLPVESGNRYIINYFPNFRSLGGEPFDIYAKDYFLINNDTANRIEYDPQVQLLDSTIKKYVYGTPYSTNDSNGITGPHYNFTGQRMGVVSNRNNGMPAEQKQTKFLEDARNILGSVTDPSDMVSAYETLKKEARESGLVVIPSTYPLSYEDLIYAIQNSNSTKEQDADAVLQSFSAGLLNNVQFSVVSEAIKMKFSPGATVTTVSSLTEDQQKEIQFQKELVTLQLNKNNMTFPAYVSSVINLYNTYGKTPPTTF